MREAIWRTLIADQAALSETRRQESRRFCTGEIPPPGIYGHLYDVFMQIPGVPDDFFEDQESLNAKELALLYTEPLVKRFSEVLNDCSDFITKHGFIGIDPSSMKAGDLVVILFGADVPFILRQEGGHHTLLGDCYVHASWRPN